MAALGWSDDSRLLVAYDHDLETPLFTWTYAAFEKFLNESITPSMYHFMGIYVQDNISKEERDSILDGDYTPGEVEAEAVDAYFDLSISTKIMMHEQELSNILSEIGRIQEKIQAFSNPFDPVSPIYVEYRKWAAESQYKLERTLQDLENQLHEENMWRGGHEAGSENFSNTTYRHYDEV